MSPESTSPESTPQVTAEFVIGGETYRDVNPIARVARSNQATISGVRPPNANTSTMHAEFGAMFQAYQQGVRQGHGRLIVAGLRVCPYCRGDVKTLARLMGLDTLTVEETDGTVIEFIGPTDLLPVKQGGKPWK